MREIDGPFRFTWDFCLVWALFLIVALYLVPSSKSAHAYEHPLAALLASLFATFLLYGTILLVRQIFASGSRGWFVARAFVSVLLVILLGAGVFYFVPYTPRRGHVFVFVAAVASTLYLQWRLDSSSPK
jgi:predicted Kef-type K+ transport protein